MEATINQLNNQLIDQQQGLLLPEPLKQTIQTLLTTLLLSTATSPGLRNSSLLLATNLNRLKINLKPQLIIQLITNYLESNQTIIKQIIDDNLNRNHQLKQQLNLHIQLLIQKLTTEPEQQTTIQQLRLISQSHPSLLESFYTTTAQDTIKPFAELIKLIEQERAEEEEELFRRELLFIILHVLKQGIIPKLRSATVAFDSSELKDQLISLLSSKSIRLLTELYLNYPNLLEDLQGLPQATNTKKTKQDPLLNFFTPEQRACHPIFKIYYDDHAGKANDRPELDSIINEVLSVLPDLASPEILRLIIQEHVNFQDPQQGAQRLIERSFNDPQFIQSYSTTESINHSLPQQSDHQLIQKRQNIFDDRKMDPSLLRIGKTKLDENEILNDKSHLTKEMKRQMKARLERIEDEEEKRDESGRTEQVLLYSDDEEDEGKNEQAMGVDIFSDDDHRFNLRQDSDESDPEDAASQSSSSSSSSSSPTPPANARSKPTRGRANKALQQPEQRNRPQNESEGWGVDEEVLCSFYLNDPRVFLPASRSSKSRVALKARLKGPKQDDLIEAWKTMFERNPKKEEILEKYRLQSAIQDPNNRGTKMIDSRGEEGSRGREGGGGRGGGGGAGSMRGRGAGANRGRGGRGNARGRGGKPTTDGGGRGGGTGLTEPTAPPSSSNQTRPRGTDHRNPAGQSSRANHSKSISNRKVRGRDKKLAFISGGGGGGGGPD
ncbi:uncharacterized protein PGTG_02110 [Puccinia graminis f. sp. tritici CRL 75-36-700-3]|uniref:CUE domain-containing protein n=1 Tax=Puccinia graminis f. sp. tritici (strain CRL 75-36-700-3 / race SCCL) TaxID=418459 RepID=E3JX74_PUCGT|nr:uncharacterized protein PGTG_02110 [Puccinia graminis f. sp. tritici CRL 75-36-700-3]EFP76649.1 hypothetical protein PGTG_02110 [Puccinia graminis f. sp. tritici CRL 75-36-700-3]